MEIRIGQSDKPGKMGMLQGLILVLFGIFVATFLFALIIRIFGQETYSLWIGLIFNAILSTSGLYFLKNKSLRLVSYGIIGTLIFGTIAFIILIQIAQNLLDGF